MTTAWVVIVCILLILAIAFGTAAKIDHVPAQPNRPQHSIYYPPGEPQPAVPGDPNWTG